MKKKHPVIIEISRIEGDNSFGFSVHGSIEWMREMEPFINWNCGFLLAQMNRDENFLAEGRDELITAFDAMKSKKNFHGKYVTMKLTQV